MNDKKKDSCVAIIVSYNPDKEILFSLLQQLSDQTDFLLVDNGSANVSDFAADARALAACKGVQELPENLGLACALNIGLRFALENDYEFALLFDQDSALSENFVESLLQAYAEATLLPRNPVDSIGNNTDRKSSYKIAAIGPLVRNPETGRQMPFKRFDRMFYRSNCRPSPSVSLYIADFLISSGSLLPMENIADIGFMKEDYFIDNIDLEWCFRARSLGYSLYGTEKAVLHHRIGEAANSYMVKKGFMVQHSPLRAYYSTRNRINLYSKKYAPMQWIVRDIFRFAFKTLWLVLFSSDRIAYLKSIRRGIADAGAIS